MNGSLKSFFNYFSVIRIVIVTAALLVALLICQFIYSEYTFDEFYKESKNIYRVQTDVLKSDRKSLIYSVSACPAPLADKIVENFNEVSEYTRVHPELKSVVEINENVFFQDWMLLVDHAFIDIFSLEILNGERETLLKKPNTAIISYKYAKKYFGDLNPIGRKLTVSDIHRTREFEIIGVYKDFPKNFHIKQINILLSNHGVLSSPSYAGESWGETSFCTYIITKPKANENKVLEGKINKFLNDYLTEFYNSTDIYYNIYLMPAQDIHFHSLTPWELNDSGNKFLVQVLIGALVFIILLVLFIYLLSLRFNFFLFHKQNAQVLQKKISQRVLLAICMELGVVVILSTVFSIFISTKFYNYIYTEVQVFSFISYVFVAIIFAGIILVPLIIKQLISKDINETANLKIIKRKEVLSYKLILLISFFILFLISSGSVLVQRQSKFITSYDLGYNPKNILLIDSPIATGKYWEYRKKFNSFKDSLITSGIVKEASRASCIPGWSLNYVSIIANVDSENDNKKAFQFEIDKNFLDVYEIPLLAKLDTLEKHNNNLIIINQTLMKELSYDQPSSAVGEMVVLDGVKKTIGGVIGDIYVEPLNRKLQPLVFTLGPTSGWMTIKVDSENQDKTVASIKKVFKSFYPKSPFKHFYQDEYLNKQYKNLNQVRNVLFLFSIIFTVLIVYGLSFYLAINNLISSTDTRKMGVLKDMIIPLFLIFIATIPIVFYSYNILIESFIYHAKISVQYVLIVIAVYVPIVLLSFLLKKVLINRSLVRNTD